MTTEPLSRVFEQIDLFSQLDKQTALPSNGTPTSALAALKGRDKARGDRLRILRLLEERGDFGAICDEAEVALGMAHQTCSARFSDLSDDHLIVTTLFTRRTRTGSPARVYAITSKGREVLELSMGHDPAGRLVAGETTTSVPD